MFPALDLKLRHHAAGVPVLMLCFGPNAGNDRPSSCHSDSTVCSTHCHYKSDLQVSNHPAGVLLFMLRFGPKFALTDLQAPCLTALLAACTFVTSLNFKLEIMLQV